MCFCPSAAGQHRRVGRDSWSVRRVRGLGREWEDGRGRCLGGVCLGGRVGAAVALTGQALGGGEEWVEGSSCATCKELE